jgi:hypothetical protein
MLQLFITGNLVNASTSYINGSLTEGTSVVGPIDLDKMKDIVDIVVAKGFLPVVNNVLSQGVLLPVVHGLSLVTPALTVENGYFGIVAGINFTNSVL